MEHALLSISNVSVDFGVGRKRFRAVDLVSFDIKKGETLSLVGESSSGKTTVGPRSTTSSAMGSTTSGF